MLWTFLTLDKCPKRSWKSRNISLAIADFSLKTINLFPLRLSKVLPLAIINPSCSSTATSWNLCVLFMSSDSGIACCKSTASALALLCAKVSIGYLNFRQCPSIVDTLDMLLWLSNNCFHGSTYWVSFSACTLLISMLACRIGLSNPGSSSVKLSIFFAGHWSSCCNKNPPCNHLSLMTSCKLEDPLVGRSAGLLSPGIHLQDASWVQRWI